MLPLVTTSENHGARLGGLAVCCAVLSSGGCYDAQLILERARNDAIKTRLEEIDLGEFHLTLPRDPSNNEMTEVTIHAHGSAVRYRIDEIKQRLEDEQFLLRQAILVAVRKTTNEEFAEPKLEALRTRLMDAVNSVLGETPLEAIGFYDIRLVRH